MTGLRLNEDGLSFVGTAAADEDDFGHALKENNSWLFLGSRPGLTGAAARPALHAAL
jgi:hypothetical protein